MNIGNLDRFITIVQSIETGEEANGEPIYTDSTFHECFARLERISGKEQLEGDKMTATNKVRFTIRLKEGITEDMRITYKGKNYDIIEIQELGREGLWLTSTRQT